MSGGSGSSGASGLDGTVWTEGGNVGWPLDTESPEPILVGRVETPDTFAADEDGVWMAYTEGEIYGADADGSNLTGPFDVAADGIGADLIALRNGEVWLARGNAESALAVYDISADSLTEIALTEETWCGPFDGLVTDGDDVFVLCSNPFELWKLDADSQELDGSVALGEDPSDPTGPRGEFFGAGKLGVGEDSLWIFNTDALKLHQIDKSDLSIEETVDLSGEIPGDSFVDSIQLEVGDENVYVINANNGSDASDFLAIDKSSLEVSKPLSDGPEILSGIAINEDILLYEDQGRGVFALDGTSGDEVARFSMMIFDDDLSIWVP
jgi:hypothetical protein